MERKSSSEQQMFENTGELSHDTHIIRRTQPLFSRICECCHQNLVEQTKVAFLCLGCGVLHSIVIV